MTVAVHASMAAPVNATLAGQLTVVVEPARPIAKPPVPVLPAWLASPANDALALAVPTAVLAL